MPDILTASKITKRYGGVCALNEASFSMRAGEVHALMGENGAGKSTLAKIIAGSVPFDSGSISIDGQPVSIANPREAQRHGIGIIYQELDLFPNLSVGENLVIGNLHYPESAFVNQRRIEEFCRPFLDTVELARGIQEPVWSLPIGQMQLLAIARALSMNARILFMDEPTSSLFDDAAERLFRIIGSLKQRGVAIAYVSHKMDEIFRICDRITVLRDGATVGTRVTNETNMEEIVGLMVGRALQFSGRAQQRSPGDVLLAVHDLTTAKLRGISFELRRGEVLGVAGLVGSGRSELGEALFRRDKLVRGTISARGAIGLVPEDRKLQGLMMQMSVLENSTMSVLRRVQYGGFLRTSAERALFDPVRERLALKCASPHQTVAGLSGGNQQKALLARWLMVNPDVLFLDDPARGIDVGAKQDIYRIIDELAESGKGLILVSSELPELLRCCDRILVLHEGRVAAEFDAATATQEDIMTAAAAGVRQ